MTRRAAAEATLQLLAPSVPLFVTLGSSLLPEAQRTEAMRLAQPHLQPSGTLDAVTEQLRGGWRRALILCLAKLADEGVEAKDGASLAPLMRQGLNLPTLLRADDLSMLAALVDADRDSLLSHTELISALFEHEDLHVRSLANWLRGRPELAMRFSESVFLGKLPNARALVTNWTHRVNAFLRAQHEFGPDWPDTSLQFQVVRYPAWGHYACHLDSSASFGLRRPWSLAVFLQAPTRGGELIFPLAGRTAPAPATGGAAAEGVQPSEVPATRTEVGLSGPSTHHSPAAGADDDGPPTLGSLLLSEEEEELVMDARSERASVMQMLQGGPTPTGLVPRLLASTYAQSLPAVSMHDSLISCWAANASRHKAADPAPAHPTARASSVRTHGSDASGVWVAAEAGVGVLWHNHRTIRGAAGEDGVAAHAWEYGTDHLPSLHCGCSSVPFEAEGKDSSNPGIAASSHKWMLNVWPTLTVERDGEAS